MVGLISSAQKGSVPRAFTGRALQLLVAARFTVVVVVGALLFGTTGSAHLALASAVLQWLAADRLLGRRALFGLWKATRGRG